MKILITVEFYYHPSGGGIGEQARQIAERLAAAGHEVIVATGFLSGRPEKINGVNIQSFSVAGNLVKGIRGEPGAYKNFLLAGGYDCLINFAVSTWPTDLAFEVLPKIKAAKVLSTPGLSKIWSQRYENYYHNIYAAALVHYDVVVYTSFNYQDKLFGDERGFGKKAVLIPNGAALEEFSGPPLGFREKNKISAPFMILTVANHLWAKGHNFVIQAFRQLKRPDVNLVVIGEKPASHSWYSCYPFCRLSGWLDRRIRNFSGVPRPWVISAYREADLFLFGSARECAPLVMYEAFASRTPFITTNVGNVVDHFSCLRIVYSPREMARVVENLLDDTEERRGLAERAFVVWQADHTWDRIARQYEELCQRLASS